MLTAVEVREHARRLVEPQRQQLHTILLQSFEQNIGSDECWGDILSPLVDPNNPPRQPRVPARSRLPPPSQTPPTTEAPTVDTRQLGYNEQRARDDTITKETQRIITEYSLPKLSHTAQLYGWIQDITAYIDTATQCNHSNKMWRAILAHIINSLFTPSDVKRPELDNIYGAIRQLAENCHDDANPIAESFWKKHVVPNLTHKFDNYAAHAYGHSHLGLIQGENEAGLHFIERAITRVAAIDYTESLIPVDKNLLSQIVAALNPETRSFFEETLSRHDITTFSDLVTKLPELKKTTFSRKQAFMQGQNVATPAVNQELEVYAVLKRGREAATLGAVCYRCHCIGHWATFCTSTSVTISPTGCLRCGDKHTLAQCPKGPVKCGRYDCEEDHLAKRCPHPYFVTNANNKRVAQPPKPTTAKRFKLETNAVDMLDLEINALDVPNLPTGSLQRPCEYTVVEFLSFNHARHRHDRQCLLDGGANVNILPADFVQTLIDDPDMNIPEDYIHSLPHKPTASVATGECTEIRQYIYLPVRVERANYLIPFYIFPAGSKALLGNPALFLIYGHTTFSRTRRLNAAAMRLDIASMDLAVPPTPPPCNPPPPPTLPAPGPFITKKIVDGKTRLVCNLPLLENARIHPTRERPRELNPTNQQILYTRIKQLESEGKISRANPSAVPYTSPVVIVDKDAALKKPRVFPEDPAELQRRYRITLDNRGINNMKLYVTDERIVFVPGRIGLDDKSTAAAWSFAPTARHVLREFRVENCVSWAKTDMTNAFDQVLLSEGLRPLFGADIFNPTTREWEVYTWNVLPQGWTLSPMFFRLAVDELKAATLAKLGSLDIPIQPQLKNLADDLLMGGSSNATVSTMQTTLHEVLHDHGFPVNPAKCTPATKETTFCGSLLSGCLVQPTATRKPILESFTESAWAELTAGNVDKLKWLRSMAGHFQFLKGHLDAAMVEHLRVFYEAISAVQNDPNTPVDTPATHLALKELVTYACNGLPQLVMAKFPEVHATLIVVDASPTSWAATLFLLATVPDSTAAQLPDTAAIVAQLRKTEQFRHQHLPPNLGLVPSFVLAETFTEKGASSTWYERRAQIEAVHALYHLCEGPIYVVSDNANSGKIWHDVDASFSGTAYAKLQHFQANVAGVLWQQRDNLPSIADALARIVDAYKKPRPALPNSTQINPRDQPAPTAQPGHTKPKKKRTKRPHRNPRTSTQSDKTTDPITVAAAAADTTLPPELHAFLELVKTKYAGDTTQFVPNVSMSIAYNILRSPSPPTTKLQRLAHHRFRLDASGLMYLKSPSVPDRLYIPSFNTTDLSPDRTYRHSRGFLINHFHCGSGPHLGITRTEADLCRSFFWPKMRNDVARFVGACTTCHTTKANHRPKTGTLSSTVAQAQHPFDLLLMDFASIPNTNDSFLLVMDAFTHYTFAVRTKDQKAETVHRVLLDIFTSLSVPNRIHSDRGAHFDADLIHEMMRTLAIEQTFSPPGLPRAQGAAEVAVKSLKTMLLTTLASRRPNDSIDLALRAAVQTHNATAHVRLGLCPTEILLGFRPRLPGKWPPASPSEDGPMSIPDLETIRHAIRTVWRVRRDEYIARFQDAYFMASKDSKIAPGDFVQYQPPLMGCGKTFPNPRGFFRVMKAAGSNTWHLSKEQWTPHQPLEHFTLGDIAPVNHLVRFVPAADLRAGLDQPPPPPAPPTRPTTRSLTRSQAPAPPGGGRGG